VISAPEGQDELILFLLHPVDDQLGNALLEQVGVDQSGLVPEELTAPAEVLRKKFRYFALEQWTHIGSHPVPELALAFVEVVDGREVKVLLVPAEECLPLPHITVGAVDALDGVPETVLEHRVEVL
jgi:hypothetical protein